MHNIYIYIYAYYTRDVYMMCIYTAGTLLRIQCKVFLL